MTQFHGAPRIVQSVHSGGHLHVGWEDATRLSAAALISLFMVYFCLRAARSLYACVVRPAPRPHAQ